mgnify:CR=1 FL=1
MTKPIFIVGVPRCQTIEELEDIRNSLENKFTDYHTIIIQKYIDDFEFEVLSETGIHKLGLTELDQAIKELKKRNNISAISRD